MKRELLAVLAIALVAAGGVGDGVAAQKLKIIKAPDPWMPATVQTVHDPDLSLAPPDGAGCLVIGYYVMRDGTVSKPRMMQGAFTRGTPEAVQTSFASAAVAAAADWAFQRSPKARGEPYSVFEWTVLGYGPAQDALPRVVLTGAEKQDARVADACKLSDLEAWSSKQAVSVEAAPDHAGRMLVPRDEPFNAFWITAETAAPQYPPAAFQQGVEGCATVGAVIGKDGVPGQFRILESKTTRSRSARNADQAALRKMLEQAAVNALAQWRFVPGPDNPERMPAFLQTPMDFMLGDTPREPRCGKVDLEALGGGAGKSQTEASPATPAGG